MSEDNVKRGNRSDVAAKIIQSQRNTMEDTEQGLRIINLKAENFKKIKVVDITPTDDLVRITGPNGSGKTSVLDSIMVALGGSKLAPSQPIRNGADKAEIVIDLGRFRVTRRFTRGEKQPPIIVENADGSRFRSAQSMLDEMLGELSFDPLAFSRMPAKQQFDELKIMAGLGKEFDDIDRINREDYEKRTVLNRKAKEGHAAAESIHVDDSLPRTRANVAALADELQSMIDSNALIEKDKANRKQEDGKAKELRERSEEIRGSIAANLEMVDRDAERNAIVLNEQIEALKARVAKLHDDAAKAKVAIRAKLATDADSADARAKAIEDRLASLPPILEPSDTHGVRDSLAKAGSVNANLDKADRRDQLAKEAKEAESQSAELTKAIESRTAKKAEMIRAASLPVDGIGFGDDVVTYNGVPLDQASSSEQLRVSVAIAMAANPKLRIIRVQDGSLLDSNGIAILGEMAKTNGFQVWVESVDESGAVGVVMNDGEVSN